MQSNIKKKLSNKILTSLFLLLMWTAVQAAEPLWTMVPASGSNSTQRVPENKTATMQYVVNNQSSKPKNLVIQSIPGITQTAPCQLTPKGQAGSSRILNLLITGSALPQAGVHGGPVLCQANPDGSPNPNQCYQPSSANSLHLTKAPAVGATITLDPSTLNFVAGNNGVLTITNSTASPEPAANVVATIPFGSNISLQSTTCGASLAIGTSCTITFTAPAAEGPTTIGISGSNTNTVNTAVTVTPVPMATIDVTPSTLLFVENSTGGVTVTNSPSSPVAAENVVATIPFGSNISLQSTTCGASLAIGTSCTITFTAPAAEGPTTIGISGSNTNTVNTAVTVTPVPMATIDVTPSTLLVIENSTGEVTVTNSLSSPVAAENVVATIPVGSNISLQSTTCGVSLAIGTSCTIRFASSTNEGPTTIPIAGDNTNTVNVDVTVTSGPTISITSPIQQNRIVTVSSVVPLSLGITNAAGSAVNANAITVSNKAACSNLSVNDSNCASVAPGDTCTLELTSNTPYVPCTITVSGSNTANTPTTLIAFSHVGGLVFEKTASSGKVVIDVGGAFASPWTASVSNISSATSPTNGPINTNAIVDNPACVGDPNNCAAQRCRTIGAVWYLPAINELTSIRNALCSNALSPCNFGLFSDTSYWSSTQSGISIASIVPFPSGNVSGGSKTSSLSVRCVRAF